MTPHTKLILFDIDGTLLLCGPQIGPIFVDALDRVFGASVRPNGYSFSGKTDPRIALDLVGAAGHAEDDILPRLDEVRRIYFENLEADLDRERMRLLPGVMETLERLVVRDDVTLGLLTGNWRTSAGIKLGHFDLERYFAFGAFGDDAVDRRDLVPVALERAAVAAGRRFAPEEALIVGDSELDVDCARAAGVPCLAVATGHTPAERLEAAGADFVVADLLMAAQELEPFCIKPGG